MLAGCAGVPGPVKPVIPDRPGTVVHALKVLQAACIIYVVFLALFIKWLQPKPFALFASILLGFGLGVGYSFLHAYYRARQTQLSSLVSFYNSKLPTPVLLMSPLQYYVSASSSAFMLEGCQTTSLYYFSVSSFEAS